VTEQQLAAFEATVAANHAEAAEVGIPDDQYDSGLSVAAARVLLAAVRDLREALREVRADLIDPNDLDVENALRTIAWEFPDEPPA